jgi:hypothetical protein
MFSNQKRMTIFLVLVIIGIGCVMFWTCSSSFKSTFNALSESDSTSIMPNISDDTVLIFYAPWCGYCKRSMSEFENAVSQGDGMVVLIDTTKEMYKPLVEEYNIKAFPTIIRGDGTKYTGDRTADNIVEFSKNKSA